MKDILEIIKSRKNILKKHCSEIELSIEEPVSKADILSIEKELQIKFPAELKQFFLECSADVNFSWGLSKNTLKLLPEELQEVEFGSFTLNLNELPEVLANWSAWGNASLDYEFEDLFPVLDVPNGDEIVMVVKGSDKGKIIYLDHESEEYYCLGKSLYEFLKDWALLCCPGPEWWLLEPFYNPELEKLSLDLETSKKWLEILNLV